MNKWLIALVVAVSVVTTAWAAPKLRKTTRDPSVQETDMASPVLFVLGPDGKPKFILVSDLILTMRSDGLIGWRMSAEAEKRMLEDQAKGPKLPSPDYSSGKR